MKLKNKRDLVAPLIANLLNNISSKDHIVFKSKLNFSRKKIEGRFFCGIVKLSTKETCFFSLPIDYWAKIKCVEYARCPFKIVDLNNVEVLEGWLND